MSDVNGAVNVCKPYSTFRILIRNHTGAQFELVNLSLENGSVATGSDKFINAAQYGHFTTWEFDIFHQPRGRVDFALTGDYQPALSLSFNCRTKGEPHITLSAMPLGGYVSASLELVASSDLSELIALIHVHRREGGAFG